MKRSELVSLVVPVYNVERHLPQLFDDLKAQLYSSWLTIFVDDGSTDGSWDLLERFRCEYPNQVTIIRQSNQGPGEARNRGYSEVVTPFLIFVDADDRIEPSFISSLLQTAETTGADIVLCNYMVHEAGKVRPAREMSKRIRTTADAIVFANPAPWNKIFRKEFLDYHGLKFPHYLYEDLAEITRLLSCSKKTVAIPDYLYHYIKHGESVTSPWNERSLDILKAVDFLFFLRSSSPGHETELDFVIFRVLRVYQKRWAAFPPSSLTEKGLDELNKRLRQVEPYLSKNKYFRLDAQEQSRRRWVSWWSRLPRRVIKLLLGQYRGKRA